MVLGSLQTTFVVGGITATVSAVAAHRINNGETPFPDIFRAREPKEGERPTKVTKNGVDVTDQVPA